MVFFLYCTCAHPDLHDVAHAVPTRRSSDLPTRSGGGPDLHTRYAAAPVTETVAEHARIVRELATRRRVIREATRLVQRASNCESEVGTLAADAVNALT